MTKAEFKKLRIDKSLIEFAGSNYLYVGCFPKTNPTHVIIEDEPNHYDKININGCEVAKF